ncbi:MAG: nuclear transport factor 2 family protein, partial [Pseudomonadota bacterium]|nr:nuclear transport factor 2 family protein [Pseudomonadota bacterium]
MALCTPDVTWLRAGKMLAGRAAIVAELKPRSTTQVVRHLLTNILVDVRDAGHADLKCLLTAYRHDTGEKPAVAPTIRMPILLLVVTARLIREGDCWLIAEQVMKREFVFEDEG